MGLLEKNSNPIKLPDFFSQIKLTLLQTKEEHEILEKYFRLYNMEWSNRVFGIYYRNYKDKIGAILLLIPRITVLYLEVLIETRGMITIIDEDLVIIQEVSKMLDHFRSILMQFHVILRKPEKVEEKMHVKA